MSIKHALLAGAALLALGSPALPQVNVVPQVGVLSGIVSQPTYTATSVGLVPAASATDIFCINGSTSRTVEIRRIIISGTAGTAITTPVLVMYNSALDTGGTPATSKALPAGVPLNPKGAATTSSAQVAYTANPTINASSPVLLAAVSVPFLVTTGGQTPFELDFGSGAGGGMSFDQGLIIPKASTVAAQVCLNLNGVSISSGVLNISAEWVEY